MDWKDLIQTIYYVAGTIAALGTVVAAFIGLWVYKKNSRFERARWASELYRSFYQEKDLKSVRDRLDCPAGSEDVNKLVNDESPEFTDYLNFFEYIAFLRNAKQLHDSEVHDLFGYYLDCLRHHEPVLAYVRKSENGYEGLAGLIGSAVIKRELIGN
jgi:hypothetical protein